MTSSHGDVIVASSAVSATTISLRTHFQLAADGDAMLRNECGAYALACVQGSNTIIHRPYPQNPEGKSSESRSHTYTYTNTHPRPRPSWARTHDVAT